MPFTTHSTHHKRNKRQEGKWYWSLWKCTRAVGYKKSLTRCQVLKETCGILFLEWNIFDISISKEDFSIFSCAHLRAVWNHFGLMKCNGKTTHLLGDARYYFRVLFTCFGRAFFRVLSFPQILATIKDEKKLLGLAGRANVTHKK